MRRKKLRICSSGAQEPWNCIVGNFKIAGNLADISEAIGVLQQAAQIYPNGHPELRETLNKLWLSFVLRIERTGDPLDIAQAISAQQRAIQLTPNGHPDMPSQLGNLGSSFLYRFKHSSMGDLSDLSEVISILQHAIQLSPNGHPDMPAQLTNLGISFRNRFEHTGDLSDLAEAISVQQRGIQLGPNGHPDMPLWLTNLGNSFLSRFERMGDLLDLSEAISAQQRAIRLTPSGHPDMPLRLSNLGGSLLHRFECLGDLLDLSEAISAQQRAVQLTPSGHPDMPTQLGNLGGSFLSRFERMGDLSDLSEAISAQQHAIQLSPNGHPHMPAWLNNLGISFLRHFKHTGNLSDLSEAISAQQHAIQLTPNGHSNMTSWLNNLGILLCNRFEHTGDLSDLSEAISALQRAVQLTPNGHPDIPLQLHSLGGSFLSRYKLTEELSDLSEAISAQQHAVQLTPNGHPHMPLQLNNLANLFMIRFVHTQNASDSSIAIHLYQKSATIIGPPSVRLHSAQSWAHLSMTLDRPDAIKAYAIAIDLVSQIAGLDRTIEQRHTDLVNISTLTTEAASAAFARDRIKKALKWLEQGRCLVWSQINQLRTPVDDLRTHDPALAQRFLKFSSALESSGSRHRPEDLNTHAMISGKMSLQDEAHIHLKLASEWNQLLDEIRAIPRFHKFLRPPQASELLRHIPPDGPIILINVDKSRCDALALISGCNDPIHIPLKEFTYEKASKLGDDLRKFLSSNGVRVREENPSRAVRLAPNPHLKHDIHFILGVLWLEVVKPILESLSYPVSFTFVIGLSAILNASLLKSTASLDPGRIWWCPTGPLAFLPLHAAGIYGKNHNEPSPPGSCISDFAVSSYTPTVTALIQTVKRSRNVQAPPSAKLLIISQPNTPGCSPIPNTTTEMNAINKTIGMDNCETLEGKAATVSRVKLEMELYSSIHFACHASQDLKEPLKSGFYLQDGQLELGEIMKQKLAHCDFAFLSACQTSTGDEKLSEEAVHLAAGMLAVGYRGVAATMWSIKDQYGPVVAEGFYKQLMEKGMASGRLGVDSASAARALHHAIQSIRKQVGDTEQGLLTWVPYVHFGY